jgi:hypothetical protein
MVVFEVAPGHFGQDQATGECYVQRQPESEAEVDRMVEAVWSAEASCIRYAGSDADVIGKLAAKGELLQCDQLPWRPPITSPGRPAPDAPATRIIKWFKRRRDA